MLETISKGGGMEEMELVTRSGAGDTDHAVWNESKGNGKFSEHFKY